MDKRSRSWKLKSSDTTSASNGPRELPPVHSNKRPDDQVVPEVLSDHKCLSSDGLIIRQGKDQVKHLNQNLSSALAGISDKDELLKIYLTFTQAAFSGWEKAEAEAEILRQELDYAIQQKLAAEDRVAHLDGSLKESTQQLRQVREEQEENIHDAIAKNRREWEKIHAELEEKLIDLQQKYAEKEAENKEISKSLQMKTVDIEKITEALSRGKAELQALRTHLESIEKENAVLKSECTNTLNQKHLTIIGEKKILTKKSTKVSQRKTSEDFRKVANSARDKKLNHKEKPALERSQDKKENNRRISKDTEVSEVKTSDTKERMIEKESPLVGRYTEVLQERLSTMEEETRRLKELLEKKDSELLHVRFVSEQTANKLSQMEKKLEPSDELGILTSNCVDDNSDPCATTGAHSYLKDDNILALCTHNDHPAAHVLCDPLLPNPGNLDKEVASSQCDKIDSTLENTEKFDTINLPIDQVILKLRNTEEELSTLRSENASAQKKLQKFHTQFDMIFQVQDQGGDLKDVLNQARETVGIDLGPSIDSATSRLMETIKDLMMKLCCILSKHYEHWEETECDATRKALERLCSISAHENMDIVKLVADLSSPLDGLIRMECLRNGTSLPQEEFDVLSNNRNPTGSGTISPDKIEKSLFLDSNNIRYIENSISDNTQVITSINEEGPKKAECRKLALETHTREEFQQFHELEEDLAKVLDEKLELDNKLKLANRELEELKAKIFRFEQTEANLWAEFMSAKPSSQLIDEQLCGINSSNEASESQLKIILVEWSRLQYRVKVLEREIEDKQEKNALLEANCQRFVDQLLSCSNYVCSKCQAVHNDGEREIKEEFRTKSLKSWQSKLMLVKPLKVPTLHKNERMPEPHESPSEEAISQGRVSTYLEEEEENEEEDLEEDDKVSSLFKVYLKNGRKGWTKYHGGTKKEMIWRHGSAADILDWELASLSKSGRPLAEFFKDRTPEHDHYIQAVEELPSSSDEEAFLSPTHGRPAATSSTSCQKSNVSDRRKAMDAAIHSDKHSKSFSRLFFSKGKRVHA